MLVMVSWNRSAGAIGVPQMPRDSFHAFSDLIEQRSNMLLLGMDMRLRIPGLAETTSLAVDCDRTVPRAGVHRYRRKVRRIRRIRVQV